LLGLACVFGLIGCVDTPVKQASGRVFRVADFGAKGDGVTDDSAAIRAAIAAAARCGTNATVLFEAKRYRVSGEAADKGQHCFNLVGLTNLTVQGVAQRTELISTNPFAGMFFAQKCTNLRIVGVTVDYDPVPFIQAGITAVDTNRGLVDIVTDEGFPEMIQVRTTNTVADVTIGMVGFIFDRQTRGFKPGAPSALRVRAVTPLGGRTWRLQLVKLGEARTLAVGDVFVMRGSGIGGGGTAFSFYKCDGVTLEEATLYASPGLGVAVVGCDGDLVFRRVVARQKPGTKRILSINADGIHCAANRKGPLVEQCRFEGMTDDGMNIRAYVHVVEAVLSPTEVRLNSANDFAPGDRIQIANPLTGFVRGEATVRSVKGGNTITFEPPIAGVRTTTNRLKGLVSMSNHLDADELYNLSACGGGFVIRSNFFGNFRGRGVLLRGINGLVENNVFENLSGPAISIANEPNWPEGPVPRDIVVRGNRINNVGLDSGSCYGGAISVAAYGLKHGRAKFGVEGHGVSGMHIENNVITNPPAMAIQLISCNDSQVLGNKIFGGVREFPSSAGVVLDNCQNIQVENLAMTDQRSKTCAAVVVNCAGSAADAEINISGLTLDLPAGAVPVKDYHRKN